MGLTLLLCAVTAHQWFVTDPAGRGTAAVKISAAAGEGLHGANIVHDGAQPVSMALHDTHGHGSSCGTGAIGSSQHADRMQQCGHPPSPLSTLHVGQPPHPRCGDLHGNDLLSLHCISRT